MMPLICRLNALFCRQFVFEWLRFVVDLPLQIRVETPNASIFERDSSPSSVVDSAFGRLSNLPHCVWIHPIFVVQKFRNLLCFLHFSLWQEIKKVDVLINILCVHSFNYIDLPESGSEDHSWMFPVLQPLPLNALNSKGSEGNSYGYFFVLLPWTGTGSFRPLQRL